VRYDIYMTFGGKPETCRVLEIRAKIQLHLVEYIYTYSNIKTVGFFSSAIFIHLKICERIQQ
jgi:hypothetical protein